MKLSDNEKRDIIKLIEAGKSLPDEYRFKLFEGDREVELVWNGKTNEVESAVLPFQHIEIVDEPRSEEAQKAQLDMFDFSGRQVKGWTNKLIWGDNKYILSSLKNGPLRKEIEDNGGIKLIYIDPPFDVGADFSMNVEVGGETLTKKPNVLEELAYRDTWGKGADSFISMIYERLSIMRDLLAEDGSIYVHCDWRVSGYMRLVLDELMGKQNFTNDIQWKRSDVSGGRNAGQLNVNVLDTIFWYSKKRGNHIFNKQYEPYDDKYVKKYFTKMDEEGRKYQEREYGTRRQYLDEAKGVPVSNLWGDIPNIAQYHGYEFIDYPTQKPEKLLQRIISTSTNKNDIVADFFMGSGTSLAVAEKLGRKWIGSDLGKFSVHTARKRMISVQRQLKEEGKDFRAFEILNLGKYQRQYLFGADNAVDEIVASQQRATKEKAFKDLILGAYKAEEVQGFKTLAGQKAGRMVVIGPVNLPVVKEFVNEVVLEATVKNITRIDILAFEYEMGITPYMQEEAKTKGVDLALKVIPPDVFDKRAVQKNQVKFYDVAYIEVKTHYQKGSRNKKPAIAIELVDFSVFYNQDSETKESDLKPGQSKVIIRDGQVIKLHKDKQSEIVDQTVLTDKWTDWIDYWSVDFDYQSKKEIVQTKTPDGDDFTYVATWTGDYIFENEWQDFRTKKKRDIELKTVYHEYLKLGKYKIAVKVVDIFGNDTMKVIEVSV